MTITITITLSNLNPVGAAGGMIGGRNCLALPSSSSSSSLRQVVSMLSCSNYKKYHNNNNIKYIHPRSRPVTIVDSSKQISSTISEENYYNKKLCMMMMMKSKANATSNSPIRGRNNFVDALSRILVSLLSYGLLFTFTITLHTLYATNSALAFSYDRMGGSSSSSLLSLSSSSSLSSTSHSSSSNCQNASPSIHINIVFPYPFQSCASLGVMLLAGLYSKLHPLLELLIMSEQDGSLFSFQIAVSDKERALRRKLKKIAEIADTSTLNGLNYVLKEVVKALLQYNDSSIHFTNLFINYCCMKILSKRFEEFLDIELQRHRHGEEENTLVNADENVEYMNKTNMVQAYSSTENEYTVVTVLVLATGKHLIPYFYEKGRSYNDSFEVFQTLQRIPENEIRYVEVLWSPRKEDEVLLEDKLLRVFPLLNKVLGGVIYMPEPSN